MYNEIVISNGYVERFHSDPHNSSSAVSVISILYKLLLFFHCARTGASLLFITLFIFQLEDDEFR